MGAALRDFGLQMLQGVAGAGMGMLLGKQADARQITMQRKLQDMQIQGQQQLTDYNMMKQLQMWKDTNFKAQLEQMKIAGLSPGLMYGTSGGGGVTTGNAASSVTAGHAPTGGGEPLAMMQQGMTLEMMRAQTENIKANTAKTNAEIPNVGKTGENITADTAYKQAQTRIANLEVEFRKGTLEENINKAVAEMATAQQQVLQEEVKTEVARATKNTQIDQLRAQLAAAVLVPEMIKAQTTTEWGKPAVQAAEITKMQKDVENTILARMQKWEEIYQQGVKNGVDARHLQNAFIKDLQEEMKAPFEVIEKVVQAIILKGIISPGTATPIRGLHTR